MTIILNGTTGVTFPNGVTMSDGTSAPVTVAQGGTGANTASGARTALGVAIGTDVLAPNGSGANLTSLNASSVSSGTLSNDRLDTVSVAKGGTGATTLTANAVVLGNGTSAVQTVAPGSSGNILTSNGTTWQSTAPAGGGVTSLNGQTGAITNTDLYAIGSYIVGRPANSTNYAANSTIAGSSLRTFPTCVVMDNSSNDAYLPYFNTGLGNIGVTIGSGTWRCTSRAYGDGNNSTSGLWVRIS